MKTVDGDYKKKNSIYGNVRLIKENKGATIKTDNEDHLMSNFMITSSGFIKPAKLSTSLFNELPNIRDKDKKKSKNI